MFWRRKGEFDDLEARLRAGRPEPRAELVQSVSRAARVRPRRPRSAFRLGLAAALTLALVVPLAAVGGVSGTAAVANDVVTFVQSGSFSSSSSSTGPQLLKVSPANDQYVERVTICRRTSQSDTGNTLKLSPSGAANHLKNHEYDTAGPCGAS